MPRSVITDYLQAYPFWLMDVAPIEMLSLPIFTPMAGFSAITAPEIQLETQEIAEGNYLWKRKVVKNANVSTITLSRGVSFYDSDFWRWTVYTLTGQPFSFLGLTVGGVTPRRDLLLMQFFPRITASKAGAAVLRGSLATAASGLSTGAAVQAGGAAALGALAPGPFEFAARVPAKAWLLGECIPTRYKVGTDFDASSSDVSIQELDIEPETLEEYSLSATG